MSTISYIEVETPFPVGFQRPTNLGLCVELSKIRPTQISEWNFNSFMHFNGQCVCSSEDGIYTLGGNTNSYEKIRSHLEYALTDFGKQHLKRVRKVYVSGEFEGDMVVSNTGDEGTERVNTETPITQNNRQEVVEIPCARDIKATHWSLKISNKDGSDFSIDKVEALTIDMSRRRQGR